MVVLCTCGQWEGDLSTEPNRCTSQTGRSVELATHQAEAGAGAAAQAQAPAAHTTTTAGQLAAHEDAAPLAEAATWRMMGTRLCDW